jgi:hypothetical protein
LTNYARVYAKARKRSAGSDQDGRSPSTPARTMPVGSKGPLAWPDELRRWWEPSAEPPTPQELARFLRWMDEAGGRASSLRDSAARAAVLEDLKEKGRAFDRLPAELKEKAYNVYDGNKVRNVPVKSGGA